MRAAAPAMRPRHEEGASSALAFAIPLAFGVLWLLVEVACIVLRTPSFDVGETTRRLLRVLPFHLGLFAGLGALLALVVRRVSLRPTTVGWVSLAGATLIFLAPRVALASYRAGGVDAAAVAGGLTVLAVGLAVAGLAGVGTLLPSGLARAWPVAAWTGWSLFWVPFLRRAGPALALRNPGEEGWLGLLDAGEIAVAGLGLLLVLGVGALRRPAVAAATALLLLLGPLAPARAESPLRPDVLFILVDTLRADDFEQAGPTPALDALAAESIRFRRAYSPSNNTTRSMPGVLTSLSYDVVGERLPDAARTLPEALQEAGWATHGISANPWVSAQYGYEQGFDTLQDAANAPDFLVSPLLQIAGALAPGASYHWGMVAADLYYRPASEIRRRAEGALRGDREPLFLYVHTMDVHGPYLPPKRFLPADYRREDFYSYFPFIHLDQQAILESEPFQPRIRNLRQRYRAEIRYTDAELGKLIRALQDAGRWEETLVWLVSDHGECFGEHGYTGHTDNLLEPLIHVPLLLKLPASWGIRPRDVTEPVSTYDIFPTTASLLGLEGPERGFGEDLSDLVRGDGSRAARAVISSSTGRVYSGIVWPWKLHLELGSDGTPGRRRLFHLARDPGEHDDLAASHGDVADRIEAEIRSWIDREKALAFDDQGSEVDAQTRQQLESLGYVE